MDKKDYKYDVAFSFVSEDEALATAINDLMKERVATFIYSERQKEIAGTDGEETLNRVFGGESRIVVVLYRDKWGTTPWTRIEKTAIKNRAYEEGYDFVIFVPVEKGATLPKWLPKTQLWVGLKRWGVQGAASVIEARVQQAGGLPREESLIDRADRLQRQIDSEKDKKRFLNSTEGVNEALKEMENLYRTTEELAQQVESETGFWLKTKRADRGIDIWSQCGCIAIDWNYYYNNSLDKSYLSVALWNGLPSRPSRIVFEKPDRLNEEHYHFDRDCTGSLGWRAAKKSEFLPSQRLAEACLKKLVDYTHKEHIARER